MSEEALDIKNKGLPETNLEKNTLKLALPAIGEMLMQTLLGFADMAMVGSLGAGAIAAVGLSDMPMMTAMSFCCHKCRYNSSSSKSYWCLKTK